MRQRIAYTMAAEKAKTLQRRVAQDQIGLEAMYAEITKSMSRRDVPSR